MCDPTSTKSCIVSADFPIPAALPIHYCEFTVSHCDLASVLAGVSWGESLEGSGAAESSYDDPITGHPVASAWGS